MEVDCPVEALSSSSGTFMAHLGGRLGEAGSSRMETYELRYLSRVVSTSKLAPDWRHKRVTTKQKPGQKVNTTLDNDYNS